MGDDWEAHQKMEADIQIIGEKQNRSEWEKMEEMERSKNQS
jgi:hypothetical protein